MRAQEADARPAVCPLDAANASDDATASGSRGASTAHSRAALSACGIFRSAMENWKARLAKRGSEVSRARLKSVRSEEHTSELQSLMRISYAVFCLKQKKHDNTSKV